MFASDLVVDRPRPLYRLCPYCGRPCRGQACAGHRDLIQLEQALFIESHEPARTPQQVARTGSQTEGAY